MPLQATSGAASYDAFGGGVPAVPQYIESVFSVWLYTGNGSTQTITNGIDLAGKGGLVWFKPRDTGNNHNLIDSARGLNKFLITNATNAEGTTGSGYGVASFNSNGFSLNPPWTSSTNTTGHNYVSWTFRKQPKFFDVVTYTGTDLPQNVAHSLGSVPGFIIYKRTSGFTNWCVLARKSNGTYETLYLNTTEATQYTVADATEAGLTDTTFNPDAVFGYESNGTAGGGLYVAYLFAHNAGGFGLTGTDNVISCGSFTTDGSGNATIDLGYEPQWLLVKQSSGSGGFWRIWDTMRGWSVATLGGSTADLYPNSSAAENFGGANVNGGFPTATGFYANGGVFNTSQTHIYIAIRRGPMKVPTDATKVYGAVTRAGTGANATVTTGSFPPDLTIIRGRDAGFSWRWGDRLRGTPVVLRSNLTNAELTGESDLSSFNMDGFSLTGTGASLSNSSGNNYINYAMGRAPSFFDVVCYTNTGSSQQVAFTTLGTTPELVIYKARGTTSDWYVLGKVGSLYHGLKLNTTAASAFNDTAANLGITSTYFDPVFGWGGPSSFTYVAYFFASAPGVSKVGSYTGNGSTQTIDCGFTGGARFVLIKRTDSTGNWMVVDTARGLVSAGDPTLYLNSTAAEVTGVDWLDPDSSGFIVNQEGTMNANVSGGTYIFLAIA